MFGPLSSTLPARSLSPAITFSESRPPSPPGPHRGLSGSGRYRARRRTAARPRPSRGSKHRPSWPAGAPRRRTPRRRPPTPSLPETSRARPRTGDALPPSGGGHGSLSVAARSDSRSRGQLYQITNRQGTPYHAGLHRWRTADRAMEPDEVVVGEVEVHRGLQILDLLAEGVGQPREPPDLHADREILPLDVARPGLLQVGEADLLVLLDRHDAGRAVAAPAGRRLLVGLYDGRVVDVVAEGRIDGVVVRLET